MILAHHKGLLCVCRVLAEDDKRIRVKVIDEKKPKWISKTDPKRKLFEGTDEAVAWIHKENGIEEKD